MNERRWKHRLLLLACCLMVVQGLLAQSIADMRMSINKENAALEEILKEVKKQTGYKVFYNSQLLKNRKATVKMQNATVDAVLKQVFKGTSLTYSLEEGTIVVHEKKDANRRERAQERIIEGYVTDEQGSVLVGAAIRLGGTQQGTITDENGSFSLRVPDNVSQIEVSFVGMQKQTVKIGKTRFYPIVLSEDNQLMEDVVVTGYQTISKERATGAYDIVKNEEIEKRHVTNFSQVLDGLVAGAQSEDDGRGGKSYTIRGVGTMYADKTPLIVVDGFPLMDNPSSGASENPNRNAFEKINPNDVESITVLKDAAAASIWGARSANGVIVITTKKGAKKKTWDVEINSQLSIGQKKSVSQLTGLASSKEMIDYQKLLFENGWTYDYYTLSSDLINYPATTSDMLLYKGLKWGMITEEEMNSQLDYLSTLDNRSQIKKHLLRTPVISQTNVSVSGGNEKWSSRLSLMYQNNIGDFIGKRDNTFMVNWNNQYRFNKYLGLHVGLNLQQTHSHSSVVTESDIRNLSPYEMLLNEDGSYAAQVGSYNTEALAMFDWNNFTYHNMDYNILQEARNRIQRMTNTLYRAQIGLEVNILEGLSFNSKFQFEQSRYNQFTYSSEESMETRYRVNYYTPCDYDGNPEGESALPKGGILQPGEGKNTGVVFRNDFSFDRTFNGVHSISVVAGNEISNYRTTTLSLPYIYGVGSGNEGTGQSGYVGTMDGYTSTIYGVPAEGKTYVSESYNNNRYVSFYGNASYMYDDRYGISASARSDASNLITSEPKYRWSPLWSVGLMWNISNEKFMQNQSVLNRLTFRLTYGQNGNACSTSSARTTINTSSSYQDESTGYYYGTISDYGNPTLRWEKTTTANFGIDFSLWDNRLYGSIDLYDKKGTDILGSVTVPYVTGTYSAIFNNAELQNRGIEISLGGVAKLGQLEFSGNVTYAYNKNKVTSLYTELSTVSDLINAYYVEGKAMSPIFAYDYLGEKDGIPYLSDGKGGEIAITDWSIWTDSSLMGMARYMGTSISPHTLGVSLNLSYKGLMLSALFNGRFGGKFYLPTFNYNTFDSYSKTSISASIRDVLAGDPSCMPIPDSSVSYSDYQFWSYYYSNLASRVADASYIYCKEIILNYEVPKLPLRKIGLKGLSLFGKVENLGLLWSANSKHYHPDYLPGESTEPVITYTMGVRVNL